MRRRRGAQEAQEGTRAGDGAAGAEHGFDQDGGQVRRGRQGGGDGGGRGVDVVVCAQHEVVRQVHGESLGRRRLCLVRCGRGGCRGRGGEGDGTAVIGSAENEDVRSSRVGHRGADGDDICLGAGIREAHRLQRRREALAHGARQLFFEPVRAAEVPAAAEGGGDGGVDGRVVVPVDAGAVFTEEIRVGVAVQAGQVAGRARGEGQGEGRRVQGRARVAAGQVGAGVVVGAERERVAERVVCEVGGEGGGEGGGGCAGWG